MPSHGRECWNSAVLGASWTCSTEGTSEGSYNVLGLSRWEAWWSWVFHTWGVDFNLLKPSVNINRKNIFFWSTLMFLPFAIFLLNNLCQGKRDCVAPWHPCKQQQLLPTGEQACRSLVQNGWPCYQAVFCSAWISEKSQGDGKGLSGFFVPFACHSGVILLHLPPLIMQQLWEKRKEVAEPSKH